MRVKEQVRSPVRSPVGGSPGNTIPRTGLLFYARAPGMVDTIGESSILYQSGDAATWQTTAVWGFERTAVTIDLDTALGGNKLFNGETPIYRTWAAWMDLPWINATVLWIGTKGIAGYSSSQAASAIKITSYLNASVAATIALAWNSALGIASDIGPNLSFSFATGVVPGPNCTAPANTVLPFFTGRGVLADAGYTNLFTTANISGGAPWNMVRTVATDGQADPLGGTTAHLVRDDSTADNTHGLGHSALYGSPGTNAGSYYILAAGKRYVRLHAFNDTDSYRNVTVYDLQDGVVVSGPGAIDSIGDGWYRVSVDAVSTALDRFEFRFLSTSAADSWIYNGDGVSGVYVWCPQFVAGKYVHPSLPPSTAVVSTAGGAVYGSKFATLPTAKIRTISARLVLGASSAYTTADSGLLSLTDAAVGLIYAASGGVLKSTDGVNTATVTVSGGWSRLQQIDVHVMASVDLSTFKIGYRKSGESAITWGSDATFDGEFGSGDTTIKFAYATDKPQYLKGLQVYSATKTDTRLMEDINAY